MLKPVAEPAVADGREEAANPRPGSPGGAGLVVGVTYGDRQYAGNARALLAYSTNSEQGDTFRTHDHKCHPVDHKGVTLILRPADRLVPGNLVSFHRPEQGVQRRRFGKRAP
jgi:hypothetical protein